MTPRVKGGSRAAIRAARTAWRDRRPKSSLRAPTTRFCCDTVATARLCSATMPGNADFKGFGESLTKARQSFCFTHSLLSAWRLSARRPALSRQPGHASGGYRPPGAAGISALLGTEKPFCPGKADGFSPSAGSRRGVLVPPGGAPAPPERISLLRKCPRTPARSPRAGATGSQPLMWGGQGYRYIRIG